MIKLVTANLYKVVDILSIKLIDNNLYILYVYINSGNSSYVDEIHLLKINLITKTENNKLISSIESKCSKYKYSKIIDDKIYIVYLNLIHVYNLSDLKILKYIRINTSLILHFKDENLETKIYYLADNNEIVDEKSNVLFKINFNKKSNYFKNNNLYLNFGNNDNISTFNEYIIFNVYSWDIYVYNIKKKDFIKLKPHYQYIGNGKYIYNSNDNNLNPEYNVYDLLNNDNLPNYLEYKLDKKLYNVIDNYYLTYDYEHFRLVDNYEIVLYLDNNLIKPLNNSSDSKIINIGTTKKQIKMSVYLLLNNSEYIKNMFNDFEEIPENLIHSSFKYIKLYNNYLNGKNVNNLDKLFKICNFMMDKNLNIVAEMIVEKVDYSDIDVVEAFKCLELLFNSICDNQLDKLFYTILRKYDSEIIKIKFNEMDKNSKLYNFCINEFIKYTIYNIKNN